MCGITGILENSGQGKKGELESTVCRMADTLIHRGPDRSGVWADGSAGIGLGFRRLSIIDLSRAADQPMTFDDGKYVIVFNGEIYNFKEIRLDLEEEGVVFRSESDTEVLLKACINWGIERAVNKLVGMFAFAFWDAMERRLWLVRDRLGIKPLFYGRAGKRFAFASELKAFCELKDWSRKIDIDALSLYCQYNYVPAPKTIYCDIQKLEAGCFLEITAGRRPKIKRYWSLRKYYAAAARDVDEQTLIHTVDDALKKAVAQRQISDVPVGALLSGGLDSTAIVTMMTLTQSERIRTFTIGFEDETYNEAKRAKEIADFLGTEHTEVDLAPSKALDLIPSMPDIFDEPFGDSSAIPSYLVSSIARGAVTVALSGDGGDEIFYGYNRYTAAPKIWQKASWLPSFLRYQIGSLMEIPSVRQWDMLAKLFPQEKRPSTFGVKAYKFAKILQQPDQKGIYQALISQWHGSEPIRNGLRQSLFDWPETGNIDFVKEMAKWDSLTYLPDDILTKVDRASMAVSLEVRVPMLDHRLVELMAQVPTNLKLKGGVPKYLLRAILRKYLPRNFLERSKMGFAVPLDLWLREGLRDWAEELLDEKRLKCDGFFNENVIRRTWNQHLRGVGNHQESLWGVLMAQAWLDRWA